MRILRATSRAVDVQPDHLMGSVGNRRRRYKNVRFPMRLEMMW
jgi:hypothetical protein